MNYQEQQDIDGFFKLWEERIELNTDTFPLNKTLELIGKDFKWYNNLKFTNDEFRKRVEEIETRVQQDEHDEMITWITEEYLDYKRSGIEDNDVKQIFGKNFSLDNLIKSNPGIKKVGESFYDKFKVTHDPNSKDPIERLLYQEEYKKRILEKRKRDQERSVEKRLKRQQEIEKIKSKYTQESDNIDQFDLDKDWREEKLIQSIDKKIKNLEDQIKKNEKLNKLRVEKTQELEEKKIEKQKELDRQRRERDKKKIKLKDHKNKQVEQIRNKRIRDREKLEKQRILKRKEREEKRRTKKFQSKILIEEVKDHLNKVDIPKEIKDFVKFSDRYQKKLYDVSGKIVFKYCGNCGEHKKWTHFYSNGKNNLSTYCISCTRIKKGLIPGSGRRGEFYRGEQRFKVNDKGNVVERKCTSCQEFKKIKQFTYLYRKSSVCKDCYVQRENNVLTRRGEWRTINGERTQVRVYDPKTFHVLEKRCNRCEQMLDIEEFNRNSKNNLDGRTGKCRSCTKELQDEKKGLVKKKRVRIKSNPTPVRPVRETKVETSTLPTSTKRPITRRRVISRKLDSPKLSDQEREELKKMIDKQKRFLDGDIDKS